MNSSKSFKFILKKLSQKCVYKEREKFKIKFKNKKMGNKAGSANAKHPTKLTKKDYDFLIHATGQQKAQIDAVFNEFNANNPDGKLDKNEFIRLYDKLRPEPPELLDEISNYAFRTFDKDQNGFISFHEFMVAYSLTTRG